MNLEEMIATVKQRLERNARVVGCAAQTLDTLGRIEEQAVGLNSEDASLLIRCLIGGLREWIQAHNLLIESDINTLQQGLRQLEQQRLIVVPQIKV